MRPTRSAKCASEYYEDNIDRYYIEKQEAFKDCILDQLEVYLNSTDVDDLNIDNFAEELEDNFSFPEEGDWLASEFESMIGDYEDQKYEEYKDRQMGLD